MVKEKKSFFAGLFRKKESGAKRVEQKSEKTIKSDEKRLSPYKEELVSEWRWLMKKLHIYDYEKEEKNLFEYRKLRGWDK